MKRWIRFGMQDYRPKTPKFNNLSFNLFLLAEIDSENDIYDVEVESLEAYDFSLENNDWERQELISKVAMKHQDLIKEIKAQALEVAKKILL